MAIQSFDGIRLGYIKASFRALAGQNRVEFGGTVVKDGKRFSTSLQKTALRDDIRGRARDFAESQVQAGSTGASVVDLSAARGAAVSFLGVKTFQTCLSTEGGPHFVKGLFPRDKAPRLFDPNTGKNLQGEFEIIYDEFGRPFATVISVDRAKRPARSKLVGVMSHDFARQIYFENLSPEGFGIRLLVARMTTSESLLKEILEKETDQRIRFEAVANPNAPLESRQRGCPFCKIGQWGEPSATYDGLSVGYASNPYPFAVDHDVLIVLERLHSIKELDQKHFTDIIRLARLRAIHLSKLRRDIDCVNLGMNYGTGRVENGNETPSAFASFQHVHAQLVSIQRGGYNPGDEIADFLRSWPYDVPFFSAYIQALEKDGLILKRYGDHAYLIVPRAQTTRNHIRIITRPQVGHFLEMGPRDEFAVAEAFSDAITILGGLGIPSFNATTSAKRFSDHRTGQPLIIDILPRGGIAFMELGSLWVVDGLSETTAAEAKRILNGDGASDAFKMRAVLAYGSLADIKALDPDLIHDDPLAAHLLHGNPNQDVRYYAAGLEVGFFAELYGGDINRLRNLPKGVVVQFGRNSWDSIKRDTPINKIREVVTHIADKQFGLLSFEILRVILDEKLADKFKNGGNRIYLDRVIDAVAKAHGLEGITAWQSLCDLSREDLKKLLLSISQRS